MRQLLWIAFLITVILFAQLFASLNVEASESKFAPAIKAAAKRYGVDPKLAMAIVKVESNFNPNARGSRGEIGLFQLRPEFHAVSLTSSATNIDTGVRYLAHMRSLCGPNYGPAWFICFNRGPYGRRVKQPLQDDYYKRVTAEMKGHS